MASEINITHALYYYLVILFADKIYLGNKAKNKSLSTLLEEEFLDVFKSGDKKLLFIYENRRYSKLAKVEIRNAFRD